MLHFFILPMHLYSFLRKLTILKFFLWVPDKDFIRSSVCLIPFWLRGTAIDLGFVVVLAKAGTHFDKTQCSNKNGFPLFSKMTNQ